MAYINIKTKSYPVSEQDIRNEYPNTSFTIPFHAPEQYAPVLNSPTPTIDAMIQGYREITPEQDSLGNWMQQFEVYDLDAEQIAYNEDQAKQCNKQQAESLLQATDWTATMDVGNPQYRNPYLGNQNEFLIYRAQLCNIALNPPVIVVQWPTKPEENWVTS